MTGDLYLALETGEGWLFGLGDVTGHGLDAAIYMMMIHEEVERLAAATRSLSALVSGLHESLREELPSRWFASLVLARLGSDGDLEVVNAGHWPPLLWRDRGALETLAPNGPIVGALPGSRWSSTRARLERRDALVLFSDGVTEAASPAGEEFGSARLGELVHRIGAQPAAAIVRQVVDEVDRFRGGVPSADDVTVLVVRSGASA
jgi:sigma-B regulation protein RsbU (phosphoserine phosphatase)